MADLMKLAQLNFEDAKENAHLIMLGMGLALRDVEAVNANADPGDKPQWVHHSPLKREHIQKVMESWAAQLGEPESDGEQGRQGKLKHSGGKGKGKGKGKARGQSPDPGSDIEGSDADGRL